MDHEFNIEELKDLSPYMSVSHTPYVQDSLNALPETTPLPHEKIIIEEKDATLMLEDEMIETLSRQSSQNILESEDDSEDELYNDFFASLGQTDERAPEKDEETELLKKEDPLYIAMHDWALHSYRTAQALYKTPEHKNKHVYRVITNALLVPAKILKGLAFNSSEKTDMEIHVGCFFLSMTFLNRTIESMGKIIDQEPPNVILWKKTHAQAEALKDELAERIFLMHCNLLKKRNQS